MLIYTAINTFAPSFSMPFSFAFLRSLRFEVIEVDSIAENFQVCYQPSNERIRTSDLCLRRAALYPAELRVLKCRHLRAMPTHNDRCFTRLCRQSQ